MEFIPSHHPLTPPHTEEDRAGWLRLLRSRRVGPSTFYRLLEEHGSARAALDALPEVASAAGVTTYNVCPESVVETEMRAARKIGARLVAIGEPEYPRLLAEIDDAPPLIWTRGDLSLFERPLIAIVGARNASSQGLRFARSLAEDLGAEGFGIVSGLARGIDGAVHRAALETGTIGVLAGGVDDVYPAANADIYTDMAERGIVMSEQPMGMKPFARHFPMRNRIVSGLARATIVVEAAARSGSLLTAGNALDQGREVMAVPGHPFDGRAAGCNILLRDGATLVRSARDVIDALAAASPVARTRDATPRGAAPTPNDPDAATDPQNRSTPKAAVDLAGVTALHDRILARIGGADIPEDMLIRDVGGDADQVAGEILTLELTGRIARKSGGVLSRS